MNGVNGKNDFANNAANSTENNKSRELFFIWTQH